MLENPFSRYRDLDILIDSFQWLFEENESFMQQVSLQCNNKCFVNAIFNSLFIIKPLKLLLFQRQYDIWLGLKFSKLCEILGLHPKPP